MQKIKVLKSESTIVYNFNPNVYADSLKHLSNYVDIEPISDIDAWSNTEILQSYIRDKQLFSFDAKDIFIIRQLLMTGYFRIDQTDEFKAEVDEGTIVMKQMRNEKSLNEKPSSDSAINIRIDKIVIGTNYNIPANKDIEIKKITNSQYYDFKIDQSNEGIKRMLAKSEQLYNILLIVQFLSGSSHTIKNNINDALRPEIATKMLSITTNPFVNLTELNKYLSSTFSAKSSELLDVFIGQLHFSSNKDIIRELVYNKTNSTSIYLNEIRKLYKQRKEENVRRVYESLNMFNRLYNIMLKSPKSYETIINKIKANNILTIEKLKHFISKDEYTKLSKLIEITIEPPNNCTHNRDFRKFYSTRNKDEYFDEYNSLKNEYIKHSEAEHIYRCKKCNGYLFCEHDLEFAESASGSLVVPSLIKEKIAEKFRDTSINDAYGTIFCKYCNGKLYRIQNDEIIDGSIFNALSHARELDNNNTTELPVAKNETYIAIKRVVGDFIFKYDFNAVTLVKNIQKIILTHVLSTLGSMKYSVGDDNFEPYAQLLGAIYAYIYMYDLYVKDKNIVMRNNESTQKLNINQYAKTFAEKILQQYSNVITDPKRLESMITNAYVVMKSEMRVHIDEVTEKDHVFAIIGNPYYKFLSYLYSIERIAEAKSELNEADAFVQIVKSQKPTIFNFLVGAYSPKSSIWKNELYKPFADSYELILDFNNPSNYFQIRFQHQSSLFDFEGFEQKEFDSTLSDKMFANSKANKYQIRRQLYLDVAYDAKPREIFKATPILYSFYIADGKLVPYKWEPLIEKGKIKDFISDKVLLSKLKYDEKLSQNIMNMLSPDKRNKPLGKLTQDEAKVEKKNTTIKQRDIQFSVIKKVNQSFNINQLKFIGQSTGITIGEFMKGNVLIPTQYEICCLRIQYYVNYIIRRYNNLRYNTNSTENLHYFERTKLISKIDTYKESKFPDINIADIINYKYINLQDLYERYQEYLVDVIKLLLSTNDPIMRLFIVDEISKILEIDKLYCTSDSIGAGDMEADDDDAVGNGDQAQEIEIDENGDDFVDTDNIDYEMDEDEIHD